jgi:CDP-paratose 2-epimerase
MAALAFWADPRPGAVYNIGGGRANSTSVVEAIARLEDLTRRKLEHRYVDEPRRGDHICYISDVRRLRSDYPGWEITISLEEIFEDLVRPALAASLTSRGSGRASVGRAARRAR